MKALKTSLLAAAATTLALTGLTATAEAIELRFGHLGAEDTAYHLGALRFAELVEQYTDGEVTVAIFANGVMGDEGDMFEQQMAGVLDVSIVNPGKATEFAPTGNIFSIPFMYRDEDHWNAVLDGDVGQEIAQRLYAESGVHVIGYYGGGRRHIVSTRPMDSLEQLDGMRLRTAPTPPLIAAWSAFGAQPTVFAYQEIYTGLQLGSIDGLLNEPEWILRMRFHEVAPHIGLSEHDITVRLLTFAGTTFDALTEAQQDAVRRAGLESAQYAREVQLAQDAADLETLVAEGAIAYEMPRDQMAALIAGDMAAVIEDMGMTDLYQQIQAADAPIN